jgi:hypothetical protein
MFNNKTVVGEFIVSIFCILNLLNQSYTSCFNYLRVSGTVLGFEDIIMITTHIFTAYSLNSKLLILYNIRELLVKIQNLGIIVHLRYERPQVGGRI